MAKHINVVGPLLVGGPGPGTLPPPLNPALWRSEDKFRLGPMIKLPPFQFPNLLTKI